MRAPRPLLVRLLPAVAVLSLAATPAPAHAGDCAGDYVACVNARDGLDSSDRYHDTDCYGDYWSCVASQILFF
jgi:hypothetical protein